MLDREISKRTKRRETRKAIKQAAVRLAEDNGWHGVSIRKIANAIGYSAPIVYEHFRDKTDLYHHLVADGFALLTQETDSAIEQAKTPEEVLRAVARARIDFAASHQTLHFLMFDADNPDWQQMEIYKSMKSIRHQVVHSLTQISGNPAKCEEYFFNFVCLVSGYTIFQRHLQISDRHRHSDKFFPRVMMEKAFFGSIERFIKSIKQEQ